MTRLARILLDLQRDLARLDIAWALVGGLAVSARAEPRFTRDIDMAVVTTQDTAAEELVFALRRRGYTIAASVEHAATGRLATVRLLPPDEPENGVIVDLIFASSGVEPEIVAAAETMEIFPGVAVPICRTAHLIVLKILARDDEARPQDQVDLMVLAGETSADDWDEATRIAELITERGYHRDRDLATALVDLRTRARA